MSWRGLTLGLLALCVACHGHHHDDALFADEVAFLSEDVVDLMTIVFQAGEQAFVGDTVLLQDIVDPAGPGNDFTVVYDLPEEDRIGLGFGSGRVALQVFEDGVANADPLAFSFSSTNALDVEITYELRYEGETIGGRFTVVDLFVVLVATRASTADPFTVEYFVTGTAELGITFCDIETTFLAFGRPQDGLEPDFGDGDGFIDDPDVVDVFDFDLDYLDDVFNAAGPVGGCCSFNENFFYEEAF